MLLSRLTALLVIGDLHLGAVSVSMASWGSDMSVYMVVARNTRNDAYELRPATWIAVCLTGLI